MIRRNCFLVVCLILLLSLPQAAAAEEEKGLYILTPRAPRAVKVTAYGMTERDVRHLDGFGDDLLEDFPLTVVLPEGQMILGYNLALDGDLDGPMVLDGLFYSRSVGDRTGQPFTCYDGNLEPLDSYCFARVPLSSNAVRQVAYVNIRRLENGMSKAQQGGEPAFLPANQYNRLNELALHPSIRRENPLVLYLTDAGLGGVTLDGEAVFCLAAGPGRCAEEVIQLAGELHAQRPEGIREGEEVIRVTQGLTEEELKDPYLTYETLTEGENDALNSLLEEGDYQLGELDFRKATSPKYRQERYEAEESIALEGGEKVLLRVIVHPQDERPVSASAVVGLGDENIRMWLQPGVTREGVKAWAEEKFFLYKNQKRMEAALGMTFHSGIRPVDDVVRARLGKFGEEYGGEGCYYLMRTLYLSPSRFGEASLGDTVTVYALARLEERATADSLEVSFYAYPGVTGFQNNWIVRGERGESVTDLLNRLRFLMEETDAGN